MRLQTLWNNYSLDPTDYSPYPDICIQIPIVYFLYPDIPTSQWNSILDLIQYFTYLILTSTAAAKTTAAVARITAAVVARTTAIRITAIISVG